MMEIKLSSNNSMREKVGVGLRKKGQQPQERSGAFSLLFAGECSWPQGNMKTDTSSVSHTDGLNVLSLPVISLRNGCIATCHSVSEKWQHSGAAVSRFPRSSQARGWYHLSRNPASESCRAPAPGAGSVSSPAFCISSLSCFTNGTECPLAAQRHRSPRMPTGCPQHDFICPCISIEFRVPPKIPEKQSGYILGMLIYF